MTRPAPAHLRRTMLYVPGDKEAMLTKAPSRGADTLILNLEDAVAGADKSAARERTGAALRTLDFGRCEVAVRINPPEAAAGFQDLLALVPAQPHALVLPKVRDVESVRHVAWLLDRLEDAAGLRGGHIALMLMIETAAGVVAAAPLAGASPRITALIFGANDLAAELGCDAGHPALAHAASQVLLAGRAAGVDVIDTPFMQLGDVDGLAAAARASAAAGFTGKSAIHPSQIAAIHAAFAPGPAAVAWARQVFALVPDGDVNRLGAAVLAGELIEIPHLIRARRILARRGENPEAL